MPDFSMKNLVTKLQFTLKNCSLSMRRRFRLPTRGWQNVSKKILLTFSKFQEKIPTRFIFTFEIVAVNAAIVVVAAAIV